jgi:hypothetical protein
MAQIEFETTRALKQMESTNAWNMRPRQRIRDGMLHSTIGSDLVGPCKEGGQEAVLGRMTEMCGDDFLQTTEISIDVGVSCIGHTA